MFFTGVVVTLIVFAVVLEVKSVKNNRDYAQHVTDAMNVANSTELKAHDKSPRSLDRRSFMSSSFTLMGNRYTLYSLCQFEDAASNMYKQQHDIAQEYFDSYGKDAGMARAIYEIVRRYAKDFAPKIEFNESFFNSEMKFFIGFVDGSVLSCEMPHVPENESSLSRDFVRFTHYPNKEEAMLNGDNEEVWKVSLSDFSKAADSLKEDDTARTRVSIGGKELNAEDELRFMIIGLEIIKNIRVKNNASYDNQMQQHQLKQKISALIVKNTPKCVHCLHVL